MTKTIFTIPLWERDVILMMGGNYSDIMKVAEENKLTSMTKEEIQKDRLSIIDAQAGAYFCLDKGIGIMWFPTSKVVPSIIAHEATHIVDWLFRFIGAETEMEARAYTVEWLVKNVPLLLKNLQKKTTKKG